jgi:hypothetical protein
MTQRQPVLSTRNWRDIFEETISPKQVEITGRDWGYGIFPDSQRTCTMVVDTYCHISSTPDSGVEMEPRNERVEAKQKVVQAIAANTIVVPRDRLTFRVIIWDKNRALVMCQHSTILADVWLAIIDPATIPGVFTSSELPVHEG